MKKTPNLKRMVENAPVIFFSLDKGGMVTYMGGKDFGKFDHWEDPVGRSIFDLFEADPVAWDLAKRAVAGESFVANLVFSGVIWEFRLSPKFADNGDLEEVMGVMLDVTQSKRSEIENEQLLKALAGSHTRLEHMSKRLFDAQETERRKIAYELHDEIGQSMTGLRLSLDLAMKDQINKENPHLRTAKNLAQEVLALVREMSLNLRPAMLDDLGLIPTLRWYFDRYKKQTDIQVIFDSHIQEERFNTRVEITVYRIIQEALNNVAKHALVDQVKVSIWKDEDGLNLEIIDEGKGFDPDEEISSSNSSGLASIQDRVGLLNGSLTIRSELKKGSLIQVCVPLEILDQGK